MHTHPPTDCWCTNANDTVRVWAGEETRKEMEKQQEEMNEQGGMLGMLGMKVPEEKGSDSDSDDSDDDDGGADAIDDRRRGGGDHEEVEQRSVPTRPATRAGGLRARRGKKHH